jgi:putative molybdopterin biosynthesis protein
MKELMTDPSRSDALSRWRDCLEQEGWMTSCRHEDCSIIDALGRVIAEPVFASRSVPHYVGAAMDGFAVRADDTTGLLPGEGRHLPVLPPGSPWRPQTAVVVDTGDALPDGTDSVIMKEHVVCDAQQIEITTAVLPGQHVRQIGEDMLQGQLVLPVERVVSPADIAACLAVGADRVRVYARPRVCIIPTGSEIVDSAENLPAGSIRDINSYMLAALFGSWGAVVKRHPVVADDRENLRQAISEALPESDMIVINAGTSGGTEDFTATVLAGLGCVCCHGVAIRPGRPLILAVVQGKPVVGLPGYPVSCLLTAELFTQELIYQYQRKSMPPKQIVQAVLGKTVESRLGVEEYLRVSLAPELPLPLAMPLARGASLISTLTQAHGWLRIGPDTDKLNSGEFVAIELF